MRQCTTSAFSLPELPRIVLHLPFPYRRLASISLMPERVCCRTLAVEYIPGTKTNSDRGPDTEDPGVVRGDLGFFGDFFVIRSVIVGFSVVRSGVFRGERVAGVLVLFIESLESVKCVSTFIHGTN